MDKPELALLGGSFGIQGPFAMDSRGHTRPKTISGTVLLRPAEALQRLASEPQSSILRDPADVRPFPYAALIRSHLAQGRISAAINLLEVAGDLIPADSSLRKALSPPRVKRSEHRDVDRSAEFRWLAENAAGYRGKWVALVGDQLFGASESLKELLEKIESVPSENTPLVHHIH